MKKLVQRLLVGFEVGLGIFGCEELLHQCLERSLGAGRQELRMCESKICLLSWASGQYQPGQAGLLLLAELGIEVIRPERYE